LYILYTATTDTPAWRC